MGTKSDMMSKHRTIAVWAGVGMIFGASGVSASAQTTPAKDDPKPAPVLPTPLPPKRVKSVRPAVVDLGQMAKDRRPGQVMPGDPAPMGMPAAKPTADAAVMPATTEKAGASTPGAPMAESTRVKESIKLPDTAPASKPVLKPSIDAAARPEVLSGTLPAPLPEASAAAAVATPAPAVATAVQAAPVDPVAAKPLAVSTAKPAIPERPEVGGVALVDGVVLKQVPAPLGTGGAKVRVESIGGVGGSSGLQWRTGGVAWKSPAVGEVMEGVVEVRAGLDSEMVLIVDDLAKLNVTRLGRATIERCSEKGGVTTVGVRVDRGAVEVRPLTASAGEMFARVRTPDQSFGLIGPLRVEYDAFTGTRRRVVNP